MFKLRTARSTDMFLSKLYDQSTFYTAFMRDLSACSRELILESPFVTSRRMLELLPTFRKLRQRSVRIFVHTRHPDEHEEPCRSEAKHAINEMLELGITVIFIGRHHRKLAIVDRSIVWEGSLNILSYSDSCEIMRKITSPEVAAQTIGFLKLKHLMKENY